MLVIEYFKAITYPISVLNYVSTGKSFTVLLFVVSVQADIVKLRNTEVILRPTYTTEGQILKPSNRTLHSAFAS